MTPYATLVGNKYGRLTVLGRGKKTKGKPVKWFCLCDCGNVTNVTASHLRRGVTQSCGCLRKECSAYVITHGLSKHPLYSVWVAMKQRCYNEKNTQYKYYGGEGITVCTVWKLNFQFFYDWAQENGYKEGLILRRRNNTRPYTANNCRWVDKVKSRRKPHHRKRRRVICRSDNGTSYVTLNTATSKWVVTTDRGWGLQTTGEYDKREQAVEAAKACILQPGPPLITIEPATPPQKEP